MSSEKKSKSFRLIALYLPQYYPFPENDKWWGKGFTEWTNVGKAKPLFRGHYQPRVPADLGYYDLRVPETRQAQADMARQFGIEGFCYWHYWFGNGRRLLDRPFNEVLKSGTPDFPFCLAWANHSWMKKLWTVGLDNETLIEQTYPGIEDYTAHFYAMLPAFKDQRYITVENKPFFLIFEPFNSPEIKILIKTWQQLAIENALPGIYFVGQGIRGQKEAILNLGFDAFNENYVEDIYSSRSLIFRAAIKLRTQLFGISRVYEYGKAMKFFSSKDAVNEETIPIICPNWDHSPRSGKKGFILKNSTPELFKKHISQVFGYIKNKPYEKRIAIIKSWNEWGEGNYMEPDIKYGKRYLEVLKETVDLM